MPTSARNAYRVGSAGWTGVVEGLPEDDVVLVDVAEVEGLVVVAVLVPVSVAVLEGADV
jgi:hypothetical protein